MAKDAVRAASTALDSPQLMHCRVNDRPVALSIPPVRTLAELLRYDLGLTGTKIGCDHGNCGACTVLVNGVPLYSCLTLALACDQAKITTIEGLAQGEQLHPVQQAFLECDAYQCGFCTPGQILSLVALLESNPRPQVADVRAATSGNLCRCGAYPQILAAGLLAAELLRDEKR